MVQHIMPKGFQRVRYYGLQATKTFKKWADVISKGIQAIGRVIKGTYIKKYRERYIELRICPKINLHFEVSRRSHDKARGGRIASYLTDDQRSHAGWIGASKCEVIFGRVLSSRDPLLCSYCGRLTPRDSALSSCGYDLYQFMDLV
jgi:hypothetical protein